MYWSRLVFSIGLVHMIACEEKDTGLPDIDNDGVIDSEDCDAQNAAINASATDTVGDDIDQNCDGIDGTDGDGDGIASVASGGTDCDDTDPNEDASAEQTFYADKDGDGFGDSDNSASACEIPLGYVENADDCDDEESDINPEASEICDGLDNDCDGLADDDDDSVEGLYVTYTDADGDGYGDSATEVSSCAVPDGNIEVGGDCDDSDQSINPIQEEIAADGVDQNCDAIELCFIDADEDGFGSDGTLELGDDGTGAFDCDSTAGMSGDNSDCDDGDVAVFPSASEICDSIDNDCDGLIDDADDSVDLTTGGTFFLDNDGDGYGSGSVMACEQSSNMVLNDGDCDDSLASSNPMSTDIVGDGFDQNCDGVDGTDFDGDGYASSISGGMDCNDQDASINPDAQEVCSGIDEDCDGLVDDMDDSIDTSSTMTMYADMDGDSYGDPNMSFESCGGTSGYVADSSDCNDADAMTYPGAAYLESVTDCLTDADGDGWSMMTVGDTCYTVDMTDTYGDGWNGNAIEVYEDGVLVDTLTLSSGASSSEEYCGTEDATIEFYFVEGSWTNEVGYDISDPSGNQLVSVSAGNAAETGVAMASDVVFDSSSGTDCDDYDSLVNPDAVEVCDGIDNDCNDTIDDGVQSMFYVDGDGDGYGDTNQIVQDCSQPVGTVTMDGDCDDADPMTYPGAAYINSATDCLTDADGDGWAAVISGDTCYTIDMTDAYGDGWNGNVIEVYEDGFLMQSVTLSSGASGSEEYCGTEDATIEFYFVEGSWTNEVGYDISDPSGNQLVSVSAGNAAETGVAMASDVVFVSSVIADCDDYASLVNPDAVEVCDGIDNDCNGDIDEGLLNTYYADADGDGFGDANQMIEACDLPSNASLVDGDCDDTSATAFPGSAEVDSSIECMEDFDGDGYGDSNAQSPVVSGSDCLDTLSSVNPMATDIAGDNIDQNCDGVDGTDFDGDGDASVISGGTDCDDTDASLDNLDTDGDGYSSCDGDCDDTDATLESGDVDGDGFSTCDGDCDDAYFSVNPNASEIWYDGVDQDCDGGSDFDQDGDGEDSADHGGTDCDDINEDINTSDDDGDGFSSCDGDCWDGIEDTDGDGIIDSSRTYPGAAINDSATECLTDEDGDGYAPMSDGSICYTFETYDSYGDSWNGNGLELYEDGILVETIENEDVDGIANNTSTGGESNSHEYCVGEMVSQVDIVFVDGLYNNEVEFDLYSPYGELIARGYGENTEEIVVNGVSYADGDTVFGFDVVGSDCDDSDANVYGGSDNDGDGYSACFEDCDDYDPAINDGATEIWYDGVDQDCDNASDFDQDMDGDDDIAHGGTDCDDTDPLVEGLDADGDGESTCDGDCDDGDETMFSTATETWYDGIDTDCDGLSDYDQDGDGVDSVDYGGLDCDDTDAITVGDDDGDGYYTCDSVPDCDDADASTYPGAPEVMGDGVDQDCDGADLISVASCTDFLNAGNTTDGVYQLETSDGTSYDAYCDMTTDGGGWSRIVGTSTYNHNFGQYTSDIVSSYAAASDTVGVSESFLYQTDFTQVMIKKTSGSYSGEFAAYDLVEDSNGMSVMDILQYCRSQSVSLNNDTVWDGARLIGQTSEYSGVRYTGNLMMQSNSGTVNPNYFFMCGINESSDNDQSVLAFTDLTGSNNWWSDYWRGDHQWGTMWSFWNDDYCCGNNHIGNGSGQGEAGYLVVGFGYD